MVTLVICCGTSFVCGLVLGLLRCLLGIGVLLLLIALVWLVLYSACLFLFVVDDCFSIWRVWRAGGVCGGFR